MLPNLSILAQKSQYIHIRDSSVTVHKDICCPQQQDGAGSGLGVDGTLNLADTVLLSVSF